MTKTQTHAEVKLCKDGKIADYEKFILPGKLTRQAVSYTHLKKGHVSRNWTDST